MKEITLTQGKVALVDDEDFEWLSEWKWFAQRYRKSFYAARCFRIKGEGRRTHMMLMHRLILNVPSNMQVDHIDMDGLNNQRANIRICTARGNRRNTVVRADSFSGYKGVSWRKDMKKWRVRITDDYKRHYIGDYKNLMDAVRAYDKMAVILHGEFARPNSQGTAVT